MGMLSNSTQNSRVLTYFQFHFSTLMHGMYRPEDYINNQTDWWRTVTDRCYKTNG